MQTTNPWNIRVSRAAGGAVGCAGCGALVAINAVDRFEDVDVVSLQVSIILTNQNIRPIIDVANVQNVLYNF